MRARNIVLVVVFWCALHMVLSGHLQAQVFTTLHKFTGGASANPLATLLVVSNRIYGTTSASWHSKDGTIFAMNLDGSGFETLHSFSIPVYDEDSAVYTNSDGALPQAGLTFSGGRLYGTTYEGGLYGLGTVFSVGIDGTGFTNLHHFHGVPDGANPWATLIVSGDTLYGTASRWGAFDEGTLFSIKTDGTGFAVVHQFTGYDGTSPMAKLVVSGDTLYGTTHFGGGPTNSGVVFKIKIDGTGYTNLHVFSLDFDGGHPGNAGLFLSGNTLYGTTFDGGYGASSNSFGVGTVFKLQIDGSGFTNLHRFSLLSNGTNSDGINPTSGVTLVGDTLYGTTLGGGSHGTGTAFALRTDGTGFTTLHSFGPLPSYPAPGTNSDGAHLQSGLVISQDRLYGATILGGFGYGTIFSISLPVPPSLSITANAGNVSLTWPTNASGYSVQTATHVSSSTAWTTVSQTPEIIGGRYRLMLSGPFDQARFYRLSR